MQKKVRFVLVFCLFSCLFGIEAQADIRVIGSASNLEMMSNLVIAFGAKTGVAVDLRGPGSIEGLHQLEKGEADVAYASEQLPGIEKSPGLIGFSYCRDAVAVVVHPANTVKSLSREELKAIFTGNRSQWDDGTGVVVLIRDGFSGTRQFFEEKIIDGEAFVPAYIDVEQMGTGMMLTPIFSNFNPPFFPLIKRAEDMLFSLAKFRGAIAYLSIGGIPKEARVINIDGVGPTTENIKNGKYLLSRVPMLVTKGEPTGEAKQLIDFILSPEGQKIVERMGYIPLNE
ncbi:MAG: substrate-binding domain-containing protein [Desulfobacterales bacterium]|jgi:phosphate transport system substrate-binding protein